MEASWDKRKLLFWHLISLTLLISWLIPLTHSFWNIIDKKSFYFFNSLISHQYSVQLFWAFCNTRANDWLVDGLLTLFFTSYILSLPKETRGEKTVQLMITILFAVCLIIIKQLIFRHAINIYRPSPSAVLKGIFLGDYVKSIQIKGACYNSFPGDHAFTAFIFISICNFITNRFWTFLSICIIAPLLLMPRLVIGAHWLTDLIMGSFILAIIPMSWICCSPFLQLLTNKIRYIYGKKANSRPD